MRLRVLVPTRAALAPEKREERQPVRVGVAVGERAVRILERVLDPLVEAAAVRERAALDDAALVDPVQEEPRPGVRLLRLVHGAEGA